MIHVCFLYSANFAHGLNDRTKSVKKTKSLLCLLLLSFKWIGKITFFTFRVSFWVKRICSFKFWFWQLIRTCITMEKSNGISRPRCRFLILFGIAPLPVRQGWMRWFSADLWAPSFLYYPVPHENYSLSLSLPFKHYGYCVTSPTIVFWEPIWPQCDD